MTAPAKTTILSETEFDAIYLPQPAADENSIWEFAEAKTQTTENVWSIIEIDDDLFAIPGWHVVNVIGYNVTQVPWPHENIEVRFDNPHDDHQSNCKDGSEDCIV